MENNQSPRSRNIKDDITEMVFETLTKMNPESTMNDYLRRYHNDPLFNQLVNHLIQVFYMIQTDDSTDRGRHYRFREMKESIAAIREMNGSEGFGQRKEI